ncbi:DUF3047 domain-containing protein [Desulfocurvibacter africanus]|uniref:DUF3047 domain-containing protein n=1 Tax=Desulfocurvibacter africanus TaxID=873 RepID=UPI00059EB93D|nr:DUF3047 domain-containing protein [Desulfocurvibacter africanus]
MTTLAKREALLGAAQMAIKASGLLFAKLRCMTLALIILAHPVCAVYAQEQDVFFRENFESLDAWKPLIFPKIERHSSYEIVQTNDDGILRASSSDSASGLVLKRTFDPYRFPILRWRWKVEGVYWSRHENWDPVKAALLGSSYYKLPKFLQ